MDNPKFWRCQIPKSKHFVTLYSGPVLMCFFLVLKWVLASESKIMTLIGVWMMDNDNG